LNEKKYRKEFENDASFWGAGFLNYSSIMLTLFGPTVPQLYTALTRFYHVVIADSNTYHWQRALLPMVIDFHKQLITLLTTKQHESWNIPREFYDRYCPSRTTIAAITAEKSSKRSINKKKNGGYSSSTKTSTNDANLYLDTKNQAVARSKLVVDVTNARHVGLRTMDSTVAQKRMGTGKRPIG